MVSREIRIKAPVEKVFEVISDFSSYPKFLPATKKAKERKLKSGHFVDFEVDVIKTISYTLKIEMNPPGELRWHFVEGELMKTNSGSWRLEKISDSETLAHYEVDVSFGWLVPKGIVDQLTKTQLPEMLEAFKSRAEEMS